MILYKIEVIEVWRRFCIKRYLEFIISYLWIILKVVYCRMFLELDDVVYIVIIGI